MTNATAANMAAVPQAAAAAPPAKSDIREPSQKNYAFEGLSTPTSYQPSSARSFAAAQTPPVGTVRQWLALDDYQGFLYRKNYTLRGVGEKIEVWVANDISFPAGDCRNSTPGTTEITDAQVASLVAEFDNNMFPK